MKILFSLGVDATILVKYWQYCNNLGATVGGIKFNHCLGLSINTGEDIITIMKYCLVGKHWYVFDEAKLAVISFQKYPPVVCPHLFLAGNNQTIHESNEFGQVALDIFEEAAKLYVNTEILDDSTDGFLAKWNGISH